MNSTQQSPRFLFFLAASLAPLTGCANTTTFRKPQDIVWIDAAPGRAILYLLRAPHDSTEVVAAINGASAARLPSNAYTALALSPGSYRLATTGSGSPAVDIELKTGERRFFYISGVLGTPGPKQMALRRRLAARSLLLQFPPETESIRKAAGGQSARTWTRGAWRQLPTSWRRRPMASELTTGRHSAISGRSDMPPNLSLDAGKIVWN